MVDKEFKQFAASVDMMNIVSFLALLALLVVVVKILDKISAIIIKKFPKKRMFIFQWIPALSFTIYFFGIAIGAYFIFTPSHEILLWFLASTIIAIAFAFKDILASMIAGIVLLIDKPFQVGDRITFEGAYGEITSIGLRSVKLLTLDESIVTIPNNRFINDVVSSSSAGQLGIMTTVDVHVSINENLDTAQGILEKIARKSSYLEKESVPTIVIKEVLGMNGVISAVMTAKCIIKDARKEKAFQTEFLMDVNREFKNQKILRVLIEKNDREQVGKPS